MPRTLEQIQYGFDRDSRRTWQKRPLTTLQDQAYQYDALSQVNVAAHGSLNTNLTAISGTPTLAESWAYDPTGNWRGYHTEANGTVSLDQHRVHDRGNRMTQIEGSPHNMVLDRVGRMRQMAPDASGDWEGKLELTWDAWSRITQVKNNGEVACESTYDGLYRRVTREVDGETLHSYYNDAWRPVEERKNGETTASASYLWGSRHRDDLVRRDRAVGGTTLNETRYVLMDYFNPAAITDGGGAVKERYAFSAFGVRTILNPDYTVRSSSECAMEFSFQGQFVDTESGLMNYGYRYYAPYLGRWTCKDPIGEEGGRNLYAMIDNQAVNYVDHYGLKCCVKEAPTYSPNGRLSMQYVFGTERQEVTFEISAEFCDDDECKCSDCQVRQYMRDSKPPGGAAFPSGSMANKWYEDRNSQGERYGHRDGLGIGSDYNQYTDPGGEINSDGGCRYKGSDTPTRRFNDKGTVIFYLFVIDQDGAKVAEGDLIYVDYMDHTKEWEASMGASNRSTRAAET